MFIADDYTRDVLARVPRGDRAAGPGDEGAAEERETVDADHERTGTMKRPTMEQFNALPRPERLRYMATGRLRVETACTVHDHGIATHYVAKIRGLAMKDGTRGPFFATKAEARAFGQKMLEEIRRMADEAEAADAPR